MWEGEKLILQVYEDLFLKNDKADKTLLIIMYDESGGCYDHVAPPASPVGLNEFLSEIPKLERYGRPSMPERFHFANNCTVI